MKSGAISNSSWSSYRRYQMFAGNWFSQFHIPDYQHHITNGEIVITAQRESHRDQEILVPDNLALEIVQTR